MHTPFMTELFNIARTESRNTGLLANRPLMDGDLLVGVRGLMRGLRYLVVGVGGDKVNVVEVTPDYTLGSVDAFERDYFSAGDWHLWRVLTVTVELPLEVARTLLGAAVEAEHRAESRNRDREGKTTPGAVLMTELTNKRIRRLEVAQEVLVYAIAKTEVS